MARCRVYNTCISVMVWQFHSIFGFLKIVPLAEYYLYSVYIDLYKTHIISYVFTRIVYLGACYIHTCIIYLGVCMFDGSVILLGCRWQ